MTELAYVSVLETEFWGFKSLQAHQTKKEKKMHTKAFHKAESAFELAKIVTFIFWMPIIALTIFSLFIH